MKPDDPISTGKGARLSVHVKPASSHTSARGEEMALSPSFLRLNQILVPIDFSEASTKALTYARKFMEQFGSRVILLHVIQPMIYPADFGFPPTALEIQEEEVRAQVQQRLEQLAAGGARPMQTLIRTGQPYFEITMAAKELDIDLIIIPTHGRTGLKHVLLGSTAERVIRHAPCPVLTVREREHDFV